MSRKTMLALMSGVAVVVFVAAFRVSLSYEGRLNVDDLESPRTPSNDIGDDLFRTRPPVTKIAPPRSLQSGALRQRFVELTARRAQRMSDEELGRAVEEITKTIADQDAAAEAELEKASAQLKAVVENFPGTPSAERAKRALESMKTKPITGSDDLDDGALDGEETVRRRTPARPIMPVKQETKR